MRASTVRALIAASIAVATASRAAETSLRCDGGIVSLGDSELDLRGKCGEPALRHSRTEERATVAREEDRGGSGVRVAATVRAWTYDFGPQRFLYVVTLEGGKVVGIERGGYGYAPGRLESARERAPASCDSSSFRVGALALDLLARCGEPASKDVRQVEPIHADGETITAGPSVEVEVWTYDLGPRRFTQIVTLEGGKVVSVERGGYGYQR
ncbi:DUF2845 domain-containing protein [Anaeromyxobacter sp. Fw109-5]|uniref:DUF2845 domain-containing protein n=1 Tax=Anaeromyxobacter sp. (strain Fw109-5) TaxID=404589 RepID=UPI0000ED7426|nr:DUF2845 domain-containing protein [Anaeromyxobacter sp. Fw109-5]ABS26882.1 conserved hypothetical protein [Anaeromyxobacter sp. Fw109-5]